MIPFDNQALGTDSCFIFEIAWRWQHILAGNSQIRRGADMTIIGHPIPADVAEDKKVRPQVSLWFDGEVIQRLQDKTNGLLAIVMQRLHPNDLKG